MRVEDEISKLGTILGVWAHPDDEAWSSAGIMHIASKNGQKITCVTATRGGAGKTADNKIWPKSKLHQIRQQEAKESLHVLGVSDHRWLPYIDGNLHTETTNPAVKKISDIINEVKPDTILTFEPNGITGHPDHRTISTWVCEAAKKSKVEPQIYGACESTESYRLAGRIADKLFDIYYNTDRPFTVHRRDADLSINLSHRNHRVKIDAIKAHSSQTNHMFKNPVSRWCIRRMTKRESFIRLPY